MLRVTEIRETCIACPSQWEGELENGLHFYARYRYGWLAVTAAPTIDRAVAASQYDDECIVLANERAGDGLDGWMDQDEMLRRAGLYL